MAPQVEAPEGAAVVDVSGLLVAPGLVDCHVHAFRWGHLISLDVDPVSSQSGVTTFVDGGSAGSLQFMAFRRFVIEHVRSNLYALLNVSAVGQMMDGITGIEISEYDDLRFLHLSSAAEIVEANRVSSSASRSGSTLGSHHSRRWPQRASWRTQLACQWWSTCQRHPRSSESCSRICARAMW